MAVVYSCHVSRQMGGGKGEDRTTWVNGNFSILEKELLESRLVLRKRLVAVRKGVENSGFGRTSQVEKGWEAVPSTVPAVPLLGWVHHISPAVQGSINISAIWLWRAGDNFSTNDFKQFKCGINRLAASNRDWLQDGWV